jgi:hypothetical protein
VFSAFGGLLTLKTVQKKFRLDNYLDGNLPTLKSGEVRSRNKFRVFSLNGGTIN